MTIDFKNYLSFEQYAKVMEGTEQKSIFEPALVAFLKDMVKENLLTMPRGSETHDARFLTFWKNLIDQNLNEYQEKSISSAFFTIFSLHTIIAQHAKEPVPLEESYNTIVSKINKGDFDSYELQADSHCEDCAARINLMSRGWDFLLIDIDFNNRDKVTPLKPCIEEKLIEVEVDFPTGEVLVADWFRIPEFTDQVSYNKDHSDISLNYTKGIIRSTEHAAAQGFITIHVGNSSPTIFKEGDNLIFGHEDEEVDLNPEYEEVGYVCTDLWNVTVIDKKTLIDIVAKVTPPEKALEIVDSYLQEEEGNYTRLEMPSGKYKVVFNPKDYMNKFDKDLDKSVDTFFTMKRVTPTKTLKM